MKGLQIAVHEMGGHMKRSRWQPLVTLGVLIATIGGSLGLALGSAAPSAASTSKAPITIALITSLTGEAASEFSDSPQGFNARIALQNSKGGVNGHKLVGLVIDDQTNPSTTPTAVQEAISKGATGIVSVTPLFFTGSKFANQAGVPVTGGTFDGPEWGTKPYNTNMFASDTGSVDPTYPVTTLFGNLIKKYGGTVIGSYGYGISPSSTRSAVGTALSAKRNGLKVGVLNTSVPFGSVSFGPAALVAKQAGVDTIYAGMDDNSNFALLTALKQQGLKLKTVLFPTGYEHSIINSPTWPTLQGAYFISEYRPYSDPNAGTKQLAAALQKYEHRAPSNFPTFNVYEAWLGADLMIKGLEGAGANPTRAGTIKALHGITNYNGNGLLPVSINYTTIFGHDLPQACEWVLQAQKSGFALTSKTPICGKDIPGTTEITGTS
jgi:branched-chain amino acid transport system substrate-binding protein